MWIEIDYESQYTFNPKYLVGARTERVVRREIAARMTDQALADLPPRRLGTDRVFISKEEALAFAQECAEAYQCPLYNRLAR